MNKRALTIAEAAKAGGPGRSTIYKDIREGRLRAVKFGRSTRILLDDFERYLASAPEIEPRPAIQATDNRQQRPRSRDLVEQQDQAQAAKTVSASKAERQRRTNLA
jgi:excisionase family DNA binding protein